MNSTQTLHKPIIYTGTNYHVLIIPPDEPLLQDEEFRLFTGLENSGNWQPHFSVVQKVVDDFFDVSFDVCAYLPLDEEQKALVEWVIYLDLRQIGDRDKNTKKILNSMEEIENSFETSGEALTIVHGFASQLHKAIVEAFHARPKTADESDV